MGLWANGCEMGLAVCAGGVVLREEEGSCLEAGCVGFVPRDRIIGSKAVFVELVLIEFEFGGGFGDLAFGAKTKEIAEFGLCARTAKQLHTEPKQMIEVCGDALVIALVGWEFVDDFAEECGLEFEEFAGEGTFPCGVFECSSEEAFLEVVLLDVLGLCIAPDHPISPSIFKCANGCPCDDMAFVGGELLLGGFVEEEFEEGE